MGWDHILLPTNVCGSVFYSQVEGGLFSTYCLPRIPFYHQTLLKTLYRSMLEKEERMRRPRNHTQCPPAILWRLGRRGNVALGYIICSGELLFMGPGEMWLQWNQTTK